MVILDERDRGAGYRVEFFFIVAFKEKASFIAEHVGFDDEDVWNVGANSIHRYHLGYHFHQSSFTITDTGQTLIFKAKETRAFIGARFLFQDFQ